jgi:hypothetical protein
MKQLTSNIMKVGWQMMLDFRLEDGSLMFGDIPAVVQITRENLLTMLENTFYAGGKRAIDALVYDAALDEGDEITEADMPKLDALMHEFTEYFTRLAANERRSKLHRHNGGH